MTVDLRQLQRAPRFPGARIRDLLRLFVAASATSRFDIPKNCEPMGDANFGDGRTITVKLSVLCKMSFEGVV